MFQMRHKIDIVTMGAFELMRFGYEKINTMEIMPGDLEQMRRDQ